MFIIVHKALDDLGSSHLSEGPAQFAFGYM